MPYVYRYIDLEKKEVCYIGKVTKFTDVGYNPLANRHLQHKGEKWYKDIGDENILLQYIEVASHTDADILETWLINWYGKTGQLVNRAKMDWGESSFSLYPVFSGRWRNFGQNRALNANEVYNALVPLADMLYRHTEGLEVNLENYLHDFCEQVRRIAKDLRKTYVLSRYDMQEDFMRREEK